MLQKLRDGSERESGWFLGMLAVSLVPAWVQLNGGLTNHCVSAEWRLLFICFKPPGSTDLFISS